MNSVQWEVISFTPTVCYAEWVLRGVHCKHHNSVVWFLCELCNSSGIKSSLDNLGRSAVCVIAYKQVIFSAEQLLIPESPVALKQPRCNRPL